MRHWFLDLKLIRKPEMEISFRGSSGHNGLSKSKCFQVQPDACWYLGFQVSIINLKVYSVDFFKMMDTSTKILNLNQSFFKLNQPYKREDQVACFGMVLLVGGSIGKVAGCNQGGLHKPSLLHYHLQECRWTCLLRSNMLGIPHSWSAF